MFAELAMICWPLGRAGRDDWELIRDRLASNRLCLAVLLNTGTDGKGDSSVPVFLY